MADCRAYSPLVPAKAGTQLFLLSRWIPAFAGMSGTETMAQ